MSNKKTHLVGFRLSSAEYKTLSKRARGCGVSVSKYLRVLSVHLKHRNIKHKIELFDLLGYVP